MKLEIIKYLSDRLAKIALFELDMLIRQNGVQNKRNIVTYAADTFFFIGKDFFFMFGKQNLNIYI